MPRASSALPLLALWGVGCGCPSFSRLQVVDPDELVEDDWEALAAETVADFAAWSGVDGVCVVEVEPAEHLGVDGYYDPYTHLIQLDSTLQAGDGMRSVLYHELCHAWDHSQGWVSSTEPDLFPEGEADHGWTERARVAETFATTCENGPQPVELLAPLAEDCGPELIPTGLAWVREEVWALAPQPEDYGLVGTVDFAASSFPLSLPAGDPRDMAAGGALIAILMETGDTAIPWRVDLLDAVDGAFLRSVTLPDLQGRRPALLSGDDAPRLILAGEGGLLWSFAEDPPLESELPGWSAAAPLTGAVRAGKLAIAGTPSSESSAQVVLIDLSTGQSEVLLRADEQNMAELHLVHAAEVGPMVAGEELGTGSSWLGTLSVETGDWSPTPWSPSLDDPTGVLRATADLRVLGGRRIWQAEMAAPPRLTTSPLPVLLVEEEDGSWRLGSAPCSRERVEVPLLRSTDGERLLVLEAGSDGLRLTRLELAG